MSSTVAIDTPDCRPCRRCPGRIAGSLPYSVTLSNAVDSRLAGMPSAADEAAVCGRRHLRPRTSRVGSSFSRLNANTPAVNGKLPGRFPSAARRISPSSRKRGSTTLRIFGPRTATCR